MRKNRKLTAIMLALAVAAGTALSAPAETLAAESEDAFDVDIDGPAASSEGTEAEAVYADGENLIMEKALNYEIGKYQDAYFSERDKEIALWYKFELPSSRILSVNMSTVKQDGYLWVNKAFLLICDANGQELYKLEDTVGEMKAMQIGLIKGSYYVRVTNGDYYSGYLSGTVTFQINEHDASKNFQSFVEDYSDTNTRNDTESLASTLKQGMTYHGILGANNLVDYYKVTLSKKGTVRVTTTKYGDGYFNGFQVCDENRKEYLNNATESGKIYETDKLNAGTYYIYTNNTRTLVASYEITITGTDGSASDTSDAAGSHTITYNLNGGTNNIDNPSSYDTGTTVTLKDPTRNGYTFKGWYTTKKFKKKSKTSGISATDSGAKTFYAKWAKTKFKITYDLNGGKNTKKSKKNKKSYYITTKTFTLKAPKKAGDTFDGWVDQNGNTVTQITKGSYGDLSLKARWSSETAVPAATGTNGDTTVYITNTGSKYHLSGCRSLNESQTETTLQKAVSDGYEPCGICNPPELK